MQIKKGHSVNKKEIAQYLAQKYKKMAEGGIVEDEENPKHEIEDLDSEHETGLFERMEVADQTPIANPRTEDLLEDLAESLHEESEERELVNKGGIIKGQDLSEAAKKAIELKKAKRKFSK